MSRSKARPRRRKLHSDAWQLALGMLVASAAAEPAGPTPVARPDDSPGCTLPTLDSEWRPLWDLCEAATDSLLLRPLPSGDVLVHFAFAVASDADDTRHLERMPRAATEVAMATRVAEMRLSLSSGRWDTAEWGEQPDPAPLGAMLWAWLPCASSDASWRLLRESISGLLSVPLSNLDESDPADGSCGNTASTAGGGGRAAEESGAGDGSRVPIRDEAVEPRPLREAIFERESRDAALPGPVGPPAGLRLRYGSAVREGVCTENLAAWLRLWPCGAGTGRAAGLAGLLADGGQGWRGGRAGASAGHPAVRSVLREAFGAARHTSLTLQLSHACGQETPKEWPTGTGSGHPGWPKTEPRCRRPKLWLRLGLTAVVSKAQLVGVDGPAAGDTMSWLFGQGDAELWACPLLSSSTVALQLPGQAKGLGGWGELRKEGACRRHVCNVSGSLLLRCPVPRAGRLPLPTDAAAPPPAIVDEVRQALRVLPSALAAQDGAHPNDWSVPGAGVQAQLHAGGKDNLRAVLVLTISSSDAQNASVRGLLRVPWQLTPLWHTLRASVDGAAVALPRGSGASAGAAPGAAALHAEPRCDGLCRLHPEPGPRPHGSTLALEATLTPNSRLTLSLEVRKAPVHVDLMPPDASRGVDVPPAVLRYSTEGWHASKLAFSNAAVVRLPIGDLSMSYNVISLTSTLVALFVCGTFSLLIRQPR